MRIFRFILILSGLYVMTSSLISEEETPFVVFPVKAGTLMTSKNGSDFIQLSYMGWKPKWKWMGFGGKLSSEKGETVMNNKAKGEGSAEISLITRVKKTKDTQIQITVDMKTSADTGLTLIAAGMTFSGASFPEGNILTVDADGTEGEAPLPLGRSGMGSRISKFTLTDKDGGKTTVTFSKPMDIPSDGAARIMLAGSTFKADEPVNLTITVDFPQKLTFYPSLNDVPYEKGWEDWFEFKPAMNYDTPSEIAMNDWLEKPAGKHGRITRKGEDLIYNEKPFKLWGLNICYGSCAPDKALAEKRAKFYAKYGVNAVRLHKYADGKGWNGIQSTDSFTELDPEGLDRMDYFIAKLKEQGIYTKLSAHFGTPSLGPKDKEYVPYLEEFGKLKGKNGLKRVRLPASTVHYSPEVQKVQILHYQNLMKHKNPYTGLTYAEDPAIAFVEIINEQSILFYTSFQPLKASATLRTYVGKRFCDWLREKYGTSDKLVEAWGKEAFNSFKGEGFNIPDEGLDNNNILPIGNPWFWAPEQLEGSQKYKRQRLLDTMVFLYGLQNEFYAKFVKGMKEAGYQGEIISSNWQAGKAYSHFLNLHSDYLVGTVDRHNYFGGMKTMLNTAGSGMLSAGMQQAAGRPFMLSEWIHVKPNEWGVEGPAIIGAYGLGLQGWDVSFMFQNRDTGEFSDRIGRDRWDVTAPQIIGVFPAVSREILRGDVKESELTAPRYVHVPSLFEGKLGFEDKVVQAYDVKSFESSKVSAKTLAVAKCVVDFTDEYKETPAFDLSPYTKDGFLVSSTGQLAWKEGDKTLSGFFTINTEGTKAVVGFSGGETCELGSITIRPASRFSAIYINAQEKDRKISDSDSLLITAIARARNTDMKVLNDSLVLTQGKKPIRLEPVKAEITIRKEGDPVVYILDHDGIRTDRTGPVENGTFTIDGAESKTCYYLVEYGRKTEGGE